MDIDKYPKIEPGTRIHDAAMAIENSVRAIRKAKGKINPEDCVTGSPEWIAAEEDFLGDLLRALGGDPDEIKD